MQYLEIRKENLPEQFELTGGNETYVTRFMYNETTDKFSVSLYKRTPDGLEPIVLGEVLIINKPLWSDFIPDILPGQTLIPKDLSNIEDKITWDNFGVSVFLYVDDDINKVTVVQEGLTSE
ncbi:hypothetical protein [Lysinibacillus phage vB_LspM-01]|nr:hypothetical protein [Lysinibacillus phage vB_LspM-01]